MRKRSMAKYAGSIFYFKYMASRCSNTSFMVGMPFANKDSWCGALIITLYVLPLTARKNKAPLLIWFSSTKSVYFSAGCLSS